MTRWWRRSDRELAFDYAALLLREVGHSVRDIGGPDDGMQIVCDRCSLRLDMRHMSHGQVPEWLRTVLSELIPGRCPGELCQPIPGTPWFTYSI